MARRIVTAFPEPQVARLLGKSSAHPDALRGYDRLCRAGRDAVYWAFNGLEQRFGSCAWVPSFHCGVEVQAAIDAGFEVNFFPIRSDLSIDPTEFEKRFTQSPGPVLIIHYFGFPQPATARIADLCRAHHMPLIEDWAHSLYYRGPFYGPVRVFSLQKMLPVYDGGALAVDQDAFQQWTGHLFSTLPIPVRFHRGWILAAKTTLRSAFGPALTRFYRTLRYGSDPKASPDFPDSAAHDCLDPDYDYNFSLSAPSRRQATAENPHAAFQRRRENWLHLDRLIRRIPAVEPIYHELTEYVCPLMYPVRIERREALSIMLEDEGIETFVFGEQPHPAMDPAQFPEAEALRSRILGLPVHQQLAPADIERIAATLDAAAEGLSLVSD